MRTNVVSTGNMWIEKQWLFRVASGVIKLEDANKGVPKRKKKKKKEEEEEEDDGDEKIAEVQTHCKSCDYVWPGRVEAIF